MNITLSRETVQQAIAALTNDGTHEDNCPWSNDCFNTDCDYCSPIREMRETKALAALRTALEAAPKDPQETWSGVWPSNWVSAKLNAKQQAAPAAHTDHPMRHWDRTCPACQAAPAAQEPLTDEQYNDLVMEHLGPHALTGGKMSVYDAFLLAIRATEAAHGIGTQRDGV